MSANNGSHLPTGDGSGHNPNGSSSEFPRDNRHGVPDGPGCPWQAWLAAYVLGALAAHEVPSVLAHLAGGCIACNDEHRELLEAVGAMDAQEAMNDVSAPAPGPSVKAKLLDAVAHAPQGEERKHRPQAAPMSALKPSTGVHEFQRPWRVAERAPELAVQGLTTVHAGAHGHDGFELTGIEGIETRTLFVDSARRRASMMVRMAPGTAYPAHRHAALEECFVVEGDLRVGERLLRAGDYQVAAQDSVHAVQSTEKGCLLFVVSSQDDELV